MTETNDWQQIKAWRKAQRPELIARREQAPAAQRRLWNAAITRHLESGFASLSSMTVGFCWPFKGEFDARFAIRTFRDHGAQSALPAVVDKKGPLEFRLWWPGAPMTSGVYDIPVPDGTQRVVPDAALVPMNGFDAQGYRLGYGGGYFDRTLSVLQPRPLAIGISYELGRLSSIFPQPHDIAMDFVVTEAGVFAVGRAGLQQVDAVTCAALARRLCEERGLPRTKPVQAAGYSSPVCYAAEFPGYFGETDEK